MNNNQKTRKFFAAMSLVVLCFIFQVKAQTSSPPNLQGKAAIEYLKRSGDYEALEAAVRAARFRSDTLAGNTGTEVTEFTQQFKVTASDGATEDIFGFSVAVSSNTAIVGALGDDIFQANENDGSAYVFVRTGATWTQQAKLIPGGQFSGINVHSFGFSVAIDGDTALISAPDSTFPNFQGGLVYVFTRSGTTWTQRTVLFNADGEIGDRFGFHIAYSGNTAVIGTNLDNVGANTDQGSATVFVSSDNGATWTFQAKLTAADGAAVDLFGINVDVSGNTAIVGANNDDVGANANQGSAYIFTRNGSTWTQQTKLVAADGAANDRFGRGVGIFGDMAIVGANASDIGANADQGSAYVFVRSGAAWTFQQKISAADGAAGDNFGYSVRVSGNTAVIGAFADDIGANADQGSAYTFTRAGATWTQQQKLTSNDGASGDFFGLSVAVSGTTIIAGAAFNDIGGSADQGSAYIYENVFSARTRFDFDGDGKADISVFRPSNGAWYLNQSANGFTGVTFGFGTDKIVPADYDGDGKTDVAVYRSGTWYLQRSGLGFTGVTFGNADDIPVPADYDGDGKDDIAVFRPSNGTWYLQRSSLGFTGIQFGQSDDKPVAADYDGDGKTDVAVYRNGIWYIQRSQLGFTGITFGESTDKPVAADYDGDGKADVAVFRPSNGTWYLQRSQLGFTGVQFGIATDLPTPADYDGDGKTDIAVFRDGTWYLQRSTAGFTGVTFGTTADKPIPNAFVP